MLVESRNSISSTNSKIVRSPFLKHLLLWAARLLSYCFYLINLKLVSRPVWISNCKKNCRQKLLNMDKTYDFIFKPLKCEPPENMVSIIFFLEIEMVTTKIFNSKSLKKICRQLLSTMNVLNMETITITKISTSV